MIFKILKSSNCKLFLLISAFIFSILPLAFAQKETGSILGGVQDEDGKPIAGVTVTASNIRMGLNSSANTDADGTCRFPVLLPGEYEIKAELQGFQSVVRRDVRLFVGQTVIVNFVIQPQALFEVLEIQGETPPFDATSPSMSKTIPREEIENLPSFLGSVDLFTITPGVGADHVAYGSTPMGNAHWFDGVDITNQFSGRPVVTPNYNWIEEVQVVGLGAPAEYGAFTGVVANSVSRSGSNQFHGLVETFFQDDSFNSNNVVDQDIAPNETFFTDTTAQLGGPILRDKLWFFAGLQYLYRRETLFGPTGEKAPLIERNPRFITKLTYQPNQNNTLQGLITRDNPNSAGLDGEAALPEATPFDERPLWFWNLGWISFLNSETFLDVRTRGVAGPRNITGRDPNLPGHFDLDTGIYSQNYCCYLNSDRFRNYVNASFSHYASDFLLGNHDFKFGVQYERSRMDATDGYNGGMRYYDYDGAPYQRKLAEVLTLEVANTTFSTFAQDQWQLTDQLNLSVGVRWDNSRIKLLSDSVEYGTNGVAPRLGIAYALKENRTTIFKIHYGHYYDNVSAAFIDSLRKGSVITEESFNAITQKWEVTGKDPGTSSYRIDDDLNQPYSQQFTTGIDHAFSSGVNFSAHYIYKKETDLIEDLDPTRQFEPAPYVNPITGETITVYNQVDPGDGTIFITNAPTLFRRYHGFEMYGSKRFSDKLYLAGSIVFSRIKGNVDNDGERYWQGEEGSGLSSVLNTPNEKINSEGQLVNDVSTEIKFHGYYYLPWGINTSWYFRHFSGDTWTPLVRVNGLKQGDFYIYGLPRGSNRLPGRNTMDIRAEKMFPLYSGNLRFTLDVFNLFNTGYGFNVDDDYESETFGEPTEFSSPREFRIGVRYTF
jgi:outer membrane receptor protein involved in Fe transport